MAITPIGTSFPHICRVEEGEPRDEKKKAEEDEKAARKEEKRKKDEEKEEKTRAITAPSSKEESADFSSSGQTITASSPKEESADPSCKTSPPHRFERDSESLKHVRKIVDTCWVPDQAFAVTTPLTPCSFRER
ncbi:hypothetical protein PENNAL_c0063G00798 [Penicillium nalgiovense]|uniref:Uncharacterized protein n=1 Tax=Penicillium nalgiovense TaxID=60175 RepID=A0A1V6XPF4_PENNA|nr:hypothetical protein PENNAL_c0063G00798 [Penicillium nalgiovense]